MALFSTFLLTNIDSSLLFNYRFPTLAVASRDGGAYEKKLPPLTKS